MFLYSQISCKVIGKVMYNSTFKGRENGPMYVPITVEKNQYVENQIQ